MYVFIIVYYVKVFWHIWSLIRIADIEPAHFGSHSTRA